MIKQDIVHQVIERTGLARTKAEQAVDTVFASLKKALTEGDRIELRGFGVFTVRPEKDWNRSQSPDRSRGLNRSGKGCSLQTG